MCEICKGLLWVCESHPLSVWDDSEETGCECGPGAPCACNAAGALPVGKHVVDIVCGEDPASTADIKRFRRAMRCN